MYLVINKCVTAVKVSDFSGHYLRDRSNLDIGVLGYINIRNTLPKSGTFLLGHPVYIFVCVCVLGRPVHLNDVLSMSHFHTAWRILMLRV